MSGDTINSPQHYTSDPSGVECITITRHRNFNIGNAIKYLWRAGLKGVLTIAGRAPEVDDLNKAMWYLADEIARIGGKVTCKHPAMVTILEADKIERYIRQLDAANAARFINENPTMYRSVSAGPTLDDIKQINAELLWGQVSAWLSNDVFGCTPDQLVATEPEQNFRPVANVEPLMRILGGAWAAAAAAADRAHAAKEAQRDARPGAIIGGTVDGAFMADTLARGKGPVQPPAGVNAKPFVHAAGIGTDAEPAVTVARVTLPENAPDIVLIRQADGSVARLNVKPFDAISLRRGEQIVGTIPPNVTVTAVAP